MHPELTPSDELGFFLSTTPNSALYIRFANSLPPLHPSKAAETLPVLCPRLIPENPRSPAGDLVFSGMGESPAGVKPMRTTRASP
jgi:hypothetical protein